MDFSIVIPTRGRLEGLAKTLESFCLNTLELRELEILLICDTDDPDLPKVQSLTDSFPMNISTYVRPRTDGHFCRDYYNWGASKASGDNIMMFNDDATMDTKDWDLKAAEAVGFRKVYMLSFMDDTYHVGKVSFPKFPVLSRIAYATIGHFFDPRFRMWGADNWLYAVHAEAGTIIECHGVHIKHNHVESPGFEHLWKINEQECQFPLSIDREVYQLLEARGKYDRTRA